VLLDDPRRREAARGGAWSIWSGVQLVQQGLGLFQIERVEAFGEPAVDRSEKLAGRIPLALIALAFILIAPSDYLCPEFW